MKDLGTEIERYLNSVTLRLSKSTIKIHRRGLFLLCRYLESIQKAPSSEIYLQEFYTLRDKSGMVITTKPLDANVLDRFILQYVNETYTFLSKTYHSLRVFFRSITETYGYPEVMDEMLFRLKDYEPANEHRKKVLTRHEMLKFLHALVQHSEQLAMDVLLFVLLASTGCRISEVLGLRLNEINVEDDSFLLEKTKTKRARTVVLRNGLGNLIQAYCKKFGIDRTSLIFTNASGSPLMTLNVQERLDEYLDIAGIARVTLHAFRFSFATTMYEQGADILILMQLLGQERPDTTKDYIQGDYVRNMRFKVKENEALYTMVKKFK